MELAKVGTLQFVWMILGTVIFLVAPVVLAVIWKIKKKERITTILVGAVTFFLFALILEKPIQNVLLFPTQMGLPEHALSSFINSHPILLSLLVGLFPGVFEETGRLVAFTTILRKRKNRETSISYGIGHGGFEVMLILGLTYIQNIMYAVMINTGTFQTVIEQVKAQMPDQVPMLYTMAEQLAAFSAMDLTLGVVERVFCVMFHTGASILVFYACKDKKKFWLYPLAIIIHTLIDGFAGLSIFNVINPSAWVIEAVVIVAGIVTFFGGYFFLYKKDGIKG